MNTSLIKIGVLLVIGISIPACKVIISEHPTQKKDTTLLRGMAFNVDVFVRITNDTALLDWFYEEKIPRYSFTDTLCRGRSADILWESDSSRIYKRRNRIVLETRGPYNPPQTLICRLYPSEKETWEREWTILRNLYRVGQE